MSKNNKKVQTVQGMHDILPQDQYLWQYFYRVAEDTANFYKFEKIDIPVVEHAEIFEKGTGPGSDIVSKEMYSFSTRGGGRLALRPEGTPGVARSYIQHGMHKWTSPVKLYYAGPMFRHDKPQRGRYRQFYQFGFETLGEMEPARDIEIIHTTYTILSRLRLPHIAAEINSIGCPVCRPKYVKKLKEHYRYKLKQVCKNCREKYKTSPLRMLDCEDEKCSRVKTEAPHMVDYLCNECSAHFKKVLDSLDGVDVPYILNPYLVRGLDYYTKTVFEFYQEEVLAEDDIDRPVMENEPTNKKLLAIASGGRYDGLVKLLGGRDTPAVGCAIGIERTLELIQASKKEPPKPAEPRVFLVQLGDKAKKRAFTLMEEFRKARIDVREALGRDSISAQLKLANKFKVDLAVIIGQKEVLDKVAIIREMETGSQEIIPEEKLIAEVKKRLKKKK